MAVSIPLRYADNSPSPECGSYHPWVSPLRYADNILTITLPSYVPQFQFLLGTLITPGSKLINPITAPFQFLLGTLITQVCINDINVKIGFNSS